MYKTLFTQKKTRPRSHIVKDALVLSLPNADTPCLWRRDLESLTQANFEVRQEKNRYVLGLTVKASDQFEIIATYQNKEDSALALQETGRALMQKEEASMGGFVLKPTHFVKKALLGFLGLIVLILGIIYIFVPSSPQYDLQSQQVAPQVQGETKTPQQMKPLGVPLSAEAFFEE